MLFRIALLILAQSTAAVADCNREVFEAVQSFVKDSAKAVAGVGCDSGSMQEDTCLVAGIKLDRSCSGLQGAQLQQVIDSVREVRGEAGLGCVNRINGRLARGLLSVFERKPAFNLCCGACKGKGLPAEEVPATSCAMQPASAKNEVLGNVLVLNTSGPSNVFGKGQCGSKDYAKPISALILHEMLHAAGLTGNAHHGGTGSIDPETGQNLEERDFLADPVYGCENSCFGRPKIRTSIACLACAAGSLDRYACDPAKELFCDLKAGNLCAIGSSPECSNDVLLPKNGANASNRALMTLLRDGEKQISENPSSAPQACVSLWNSPGDPGKKHYETYAQGLAAYLEARAPAQTCVAGMKAGADVHEIKAFAETCADSVKRAREACSAFVTAAGCVDATAIPTSSILAECRTLTHDYGQKITAVVRAFGTNAAFKARFDGFRCEDFFPVSGACPGFKDVEPEMTVESCRKTLPAWLQK